MTSLLSLIELAKEPSSQKRRELLRQVTSIFMSHPDEIEGPEMALYDQVMSQLSADMEVMVRAEIANTLSSAKVAPLGLLRRLATDEIDVAEPILTRSKALSESDLLHIVQTKGQEHMRAVSRRVLLLPAATTTPCMPCSAMTAPDCRAPRTKRPLPAPRPIPPCTRSSSIVRTCRRT
jgi:uncharacterized protein (DUF2336 family)